MPTDIYLIAAGMTMTEGTIAGWHVADGAQVTAGMPLYELETEKISMEVEAPATGTVRHLAAAGSTLEPGAVIGYVYSPDEEIPAVLPTPRRARVEEDDITALVPPAPVPAAPAAQARRTPSSPIARRLAAELGVPLETIHGSGPGGRVEEADVRAAHAALNAAVAPSAGERIAMRGMRAVIAERMVESLSTAAQLTMSMEVEIGECVRLRSELLVAWEQEGVRPAYTDFVVKAVAVALRAHPLVNARIDGKELVLIPEVNVGLAVALDNGLIVPVIHGADRLSLQEMARESGRLVEAARNGTLAPDDVAGGTFTVTSLGMFGVDHFTPILNLPQVGIVGVNRIRDSVTWADERPVRRPVMNLDLTWDHRALDGAPAARFLMAVRALLENPAGLLDR
jgi:pyruvate dehydrogenase E2 component (dihydrolipoamide acetyltransferase)